ncbi:MULTISPECIES: NAD(P)/FAD-dependent oxidoreductase [Arthrobacter]|uniref:FAD-dependent oxidoreductase n=1 Tax=Arthrobacter terricola TaxID=2547396 RepID=A0A4V2ZRN9_9MICC|nr:MULTISPECIES: FAD-dependent oxidoreductase [Arthrobacter]MBT8163659.1 NAD(P)/FAD-dependent oxidoreductase [Arthrobacter sp. GN70]TDF87874.1 FAD-dependent oxidoreductase [Arthrobacter terricola]
MISDVVVIGAGPAGLSAAVAAAEAGASVVVIDENPRPGGKLLGQLHEEPGTGWWIGAEISKSLAKRAEEAGVRILSNRQVWNLSPKWEVALDNGESVCGEYAVVATGAAERPLPIPGWSLPGVMAIGAAQTLTNYYRVRPGDRVAVVGMDPLSLTVAHELSMAGADVVGIYLPSKSVFAGSQADPDRNLEYLAGMSDLAPNALLRWGGRLASNRALRNLALTFFPTSGIPLMGTKLNLRKSIVSIGGDERVQHVEIATIDKHGNPGKTRTVDVDCVCISGGLYPVQELTRDCELVRIDQLGGTVPLYSPEMETSQSNLFVAGNVTGIEGAKIAMAQGTLAGTAIASRLGRIQGKDAVDQAAEAVRSARKSSAITFMPDIDEGRRIAEDLWLQLEREKSMTQKDESYA